MYEYCVPYPGDADFAQRAQGAPIGCDVSGAYVLPDCHFQLRLHLVYDGHLEEGAKTGISHRAHSRWPPVYACSYR